MKKRIKGFAIVSKYDGEILEAYDNFEMNDTFSSLRGARTYLKKVFTKKNWQNYNKDIKVVPITILLKI